MKLDNIFSSHMVFAADKPVRIYGSGNGEATVIFAGLKKEITSTDDKWLVEFPPMSYGGPYELEFSCGRDTVKFNDIYIGEVFLFSGQSNMELKISQTNVKEEDYVSEDMLRLFSTYKIAGGESFLPEDGWVTCKKDEVRNWSALAYLAGNKIVREKNIAVGMIVCYQGASVIESWVPEGTFKNIGIDISVDKKTTAHTLEDHMLWNTEAKLYTTQLSQAVPFQLSGVAWYQGESDASTDEALVYDKELCALIDIWRRDFKNEELPFVIVQLADSTIFDNPKAWSMIQQAQYNVQSMRENVKTVICADVCETNDYHPKSKTELGNRIAEALISFFRN